MKINNFVIPDYAEYVLDRLAEKGFKAYLVGGCLRDIYMGIIPEDYDIATNATPDETKACFEKETIVENGVKHGTVTVIVSKKMVEITTFRKDGAYSDRRTPDSVTFAENIEEDLPRRDFTINAIALEKNGEIVDNFCGIEDIKNKVIRCVGESEKRFLEDALRIMRALRFSAVLGFDIERETEKALFSCKHLLSYIAAERILSEFRKLICGKNAYFVLSKYRSVLSEVIPFMKYADLSYFEKASLQGEIKDFSVALSLLTLSLKESVTDDFRLLKMDRRTIKEVSDILSYYPLESLTEKGIKKLLSFCSDEICEKIIKLHSLINPEDEEKLYSVFNKAKKECVRIKDLALNGEDMKNIGLFGEDIGNGLNYLLEGVIDKKVKNEKEDLLLYLKGRFN